MDDFKNELKQALERRPAPPTPKRKFIEQRNRPTKSAAYGTSANSHRDVAEAGSLPGAGELAGRGVRRAQPGRTAQGRRGAPAGADRAAHYQSRAQSDEGATRGTRPQYTGVRRKPDEKILHSFCLGSCRMGRTIVCADRS